MELENEKRASILSDALPYIQQYSNKVVVVKYGGNAMTNDRRTRSDITACFSLSFVISLPPYLTTTTLFFCRSVVSR